jgi:hypothetical protein
MQPARGRCKKMAGYNLPDNVSPNSPDAPWNQEGDTIDDFNRDWLRAYCPTPALDRLYKALVADQKEEKS